MDARKPKPSTKFIGNAGEDKAALWLTKQGLKIVERNYRSRRGEIDIIALHHSPSGGTTLAFVEVKTMPASGPEDIEHLITREKKRRIIATSRYFLASHPAYNYCSIRYDVIIIDMPALGPVYHIPNAFYSE
jgi:putative endonuclease